MIRRALTIYLRATFYCFTALLIWAAGYLLFTGFPTEVLNIYPSITTYHVQIGLGLELLGSLLGGRSIYLYGISVREQEEQAGVLLR